MEISERINTKEKILEAAKELFLEQGFTKTTMRQITKKAEFKNQASFYYYFKSKEAIVTTMMSRFYLQIMDLIYEAKLDKKDHILIFSLLQLILFRRLYMIPESRKLVIESEEHLTLKNIVEATPLYNNLVYEMVHTNIQDMTLEKIHYYINIYLAGIERTFKNIENSSLNMSIEQACKNLQALFLELIGIDNHIINEKITQAKLIYDLIENERLEKISLT